MLFSGPAPDILQGLRSRIFICYRIYSPLTTDANPARGIAPEWYNIKVERAGMGKFLTTVMAIGLTVLILLPVSCSCPAEEIADDKINQKVDSILFTHITLKKAQMASPTADRLEEMKDLGLRLDNLEVQRVFIHLDQELNSSQIAELEAMGIILYLGSWIPPVGSHPTGFILADMPVEKLGELAAKDYVIRLESAEGTLEPQNGSRPQ